MKTKVASRSQSYGKHSKPRNRKRDIFTSSKKCSNRRESSTSVESQVMALRKTTCPGVNNKIRMLTHSKTTKNLKRRCARSTLIEPEHLTDLISKNGKILFPFMHNQGRTTTSDEEASRASFEVQKSQLDVVLRKQDDDDKNSLKVDNTRIDGSESFKKQCKLEDILKQLHTSSSFDNIIGLDSQNNYDVISRSSKNSLKSRASRKSIRHNIRRFNRRNSVNKRHKWDEIDKVSDRNNSFTSYASELGVALGLKNSWSEVSSVRNSKTSCDVGIQANAQEIATQTMSTYDHEIFVDKSALEHLKCLTVRENVGSKKIEASKYNREEKLGDGDVELTENCTLLPKKFKEINCLAINESEKLKLQMLLLPSK